MARLGVLGVLAMLMTVAHSFSFAGKQKQSTLTDISQLRTATQLQENVKLKKEIEDLKKQLAECKNSGGGGSGGGGGGGGGMKKSTASYFCTPEVSDNAAWRKIRNTYTYAPLGGKDRGNAQIPKPPHWWCDKLKSSLSPWEKPKKYTVDDWAVSIFVGERLFYGQVLAQRDTWLSRVPATVIYGPTSDPRIPVVGLEKYGLKPDYVDTMVTQLVNLYSMREIYYAHPNKKWYFTYGCDNYLNVDYMNLLLDQYDHTQDLWIAQYGVTERMPGFVNFNKHPKATNKNTYQWALGSSSWIMSNSVMKGDL
jgi:hypothetical protein